MTETRSVTITTDDGIELALSVSGSGPDLLFVHGLGSAQVLWHPMIDSLCGSYRCWNLDLRGHGASSWSGPGHYNLSDYTHDVEAALDHIAKPTIGVGHSLGGISVVRASAGGHAGLRALYALDSSVVRRPGEASASVEIFVKQLAMLRAFQAGGRPVDAYEEVLGQAMNPMGDTNLALMVPEQLRGRAESLSQMDPACMAAVVEGRMGDVYVAPRVTIPLRLIAADPTMGASVKPDAVNELLTLNPHAQVETLTGVGHQLMMMQGFDSRILADLTGWLQEIA